MAVYGLTMKPEEKKKWVDALRSGKYEQGVRALRTYKNHFCCLGVQAEISGIPSELSDIHHGNWDYKFPITDEEEKSVFETSLPKSWFAEFFEFDATARDAGMDKESSIAHLQSQLMDMNDNGESFECIAEWIEENL